MIIESEKDVTPAVLSELARAKNPRFRQIMSAFVRHLHEFAREVKLTEEEFQAAVGYIVALGKHTNETHNEAVLMSGSLGFSSLICLINNGSRGQTETDANLLGPFWRMNSPKTKNGDSIVRSPTPGPVLFVDATFHDVNGKPIQGALVDIWQSSPEGFYENQDPVQADMNLRGQFTPMPTAISASAASSRPAIRSRSTARWANCCAPKAGTICGRRIFTFWFTNRASRR
jgi:catechol 1,2-dioxygenase